VLLVAQRRGVAIIAVDSTPAAALYLTRRDLHIQLHRMHKVCRHQPLLCSCAANMILYKKEPFSPCAPLL
jgi:hypothetical protein